MTGNQGIARKVGSSFIHSKMVPLLILACLLLGLFAVKETPKEEEPQIVVPMVDIFVPFPGAEPREVASRVTAPLEKLIWEIPGVEYVYSTASRNMGMVLVRFKVGEDEERALTRLYTKIQYNMDRMPPGVQTPLIKRRSIDDVPIMTLTLWGENTDAYQLRRVAAELASELKQIEDISLTEIMGGYPRQLRVELKPEALKAFEISVLEVARMLEGSNWRRPAGEITRGQNEVVVEAGGFITSAQDLESIVVGVGREQPIYLRQVARVLDGPSERENYLFMGRGKGSGNARGAADSFYPAVTISLAKRKGADASRLARMILQKVEGLQGGLIPSGIQVTVTRNYGRTAREKTNTLLEHLAGAVVSVILVVSLFMGWRSGIVVFVSVPVTFALTLFVYYITGYTLNRVTLFALIFVTGIVIDDSIIVVENIHRHFTTRRGDLHNLAVDAVAEVGNPTILATITVIAAIYPMAFVTGLMGPYMKPMPMGASMAMIFSLLVALVAGPWLSFRMLKARRGRKHSTGEETAIRTTRTYRFYTRLLIPLMAKPWRAYVMLGTVTLLLLLSILMILLKAVELKMLPFDNKDELQVLIDLPEGTTLEHTGRVAMEVGNHLRTLDEVRDIQLYIGMPQPMNFNGLVRHYFLRRASNLADIQVNLIHKSRRKEKSHPFATRIRPHLARIASRYGARLKVVEIPPGPPVLSTLVAEVYGPTLEDRLTVAREVKNIFEETHGVVDVDWYVEEPQDRLEFAVDNQKASAHGVTTQQVAQTLEAAMAGLTVGLAHFPDEKEDVPIRIRLPVDVRSHPETVRTMEIRAADGSMVPLGELIRLRADKTPQPIYHKNLMPVVYVVGDVAGQFESPVYAILAMQERIARIAAPGSAEVDVRWVGMPTYSLRPTIKWDGEWEVTYEVFRDLGIAFGVAMVVIYLILVGWFKSYSTPVVMMIPIPLALVGLIPGHWVFGAFFTATSMIGFIALAGIMVRNSILLIDFIELSLERGNDLSTAIIESGAVRTRPIILTAGTVVIGALFIIPDPIFQGLGVTLMTGGFASTVLTLFVIPILYYFYKHRTIKVQEPEKAPGNHKGTPAA
ncbi:MAG: efflux RND transporter permease subunit [Deltaproteobacteria bacterium]|nr:efflux RND transporter permease subunit [Deltaproteobacteria bacterium]